jgi:uncharacterized membrane protein
MYLLDPERGASRRGAAAAKLREVGRDATEAMGGAVEELRHRAGAADVFHASDVDSDIMGARGSTSRPLQPQALGSLRSRPASGIDALAQGLRERHWDPNVRNAAMWGGGALGLFSLLTRRSPWTMAAGLAGAALLARAGGQGRLGALFGHGGSAAPVHIEKTLRIDATPEQVYDMWANYENFPRFMSNVIEVRDLGANLSHWAVRGPAGARFEWDSILTEQARPHLLAWRSVPGSEVEQRGEVRLDPFHGGTRVTVRLTYTPPAGGAGQALASLLGRNPKAQLEDDLQRLKQLLEKRSLAHAAADVGASESKFLH